MAFVYSGTYGESARVKAAEDRFRQSQYVIWNDSVLLALGCAGIWLAGWAVGL